MALLNVENMSIAFGHHVPSRTVVEDASFTISESETVALVGESGSGKSMTALAIMRLLPEGGRLSSGRICLEGDDISTISERQMAKLRGNSIAMVFQEPMSSLNPLLTAGAHIMESLRLHGGLSRKQARAEAIALLARVGIPSPAERVDEYPHRLSGGMRQRVMIAAALARNPRLLIADEPTTALDVTIQAQILDLLSSLRDEFRMAILLITHDLGVVEEKADRVVVMYAGKVIEQLRASELRSASHPYTTALLRCIPDGDPALRLANIPGNVPSSGEMPPGCRFNPRCGWAEQDCRVIVPAMRRVGPGHDVACLKVSA